MANNASDIATNSICIDSGSEKKTPALSDGALLPGSLCTIIAATGYVDGADAGGVEEFIGILEKSYNKTIDEFRTAGKPVTLIIPTQGKKYIVRIDSANTAAGIPGKPLELSATSEGKVMDAATLDNKTMCRLAQVYNGTDDFAIVWWGAV